MSETNQKAEVIVGKAEKPWRFKPNKKITLITVIVILICAVILGIIYKDHHLSPNQKMINSLQSKANMAKDPQSKVLYYTNLAQFCSRIKDVKCANQATSAAQKLEPANPSVLVSLGNNAAASGNNAAAINYYKQALSIYNKSTLGPGNPLSATVQDKINVLEVGSGAN